tara:strand:- start:694 stop:1512 length:819 start_codon:yes stop_codon:yes gene_type:complete
MTDYISTIKQAKVFQDLAEQENLNDIFNRHLPTKQGHNYLPLYQRHFETNRLNVKKVLEIGVESGTSLRMWSEYFPNAEIYGFDIEPECKLCETDRIKVIIGDQCSQTDMEMLPNDFDIIIDDGLHSIKSQLSCFEFLFKNKLSETGIYVVEDVIGATKVIEFFNNLALLNNYWPEGESGSIWSSMNSFNDFLKKDMNKKSEEDIYYIKNILGVAIYRHLIFIDKGKNPEQGQASLRINNPDTWKAIGSVRNNFLETTSFIPTSEKTKLPKK